MSEDEHTHVDVIDLSDQFEPDRVVIEATPDERRPYQAVPFVEADGVADGETYEELGPEFKASGEYAETVRERTDVDGEISVLRSWASPLTDDAGADPGDRDA